METVYLGNNQLISVIVPVYNSSKYLLKCVDSILAQTYTNFELLIVNDGSTDNSLEIIQHYADKDKRVIVIDQKNSGVSASRNRALDIAKGEYLVFIDSDDWIEPNSFECALNEMRSSNIDVILWAYYREYEGKSIPNYPIGENYILWNKESINTLFCRLIGLKKDELSNPQKIDSLSTVWGKMYRKELVKNIKFTDLKEIGTGEDTLFNIEVFSRCNSAVYIPELFYHYRKQNESSLTHSYKRDLCLKWKELHRRINKKLSEIDASSVCYHALSNRISLGIIGLGLNLAEDTSMSFFEKTKELKTILSMDHYRDSLKELEMNYLPLKWKVFFGCAKYRLSFAMCILLYIMNYLRGR